MNLWIDTARDVAACAVIETRRLRAAQRRRAAHAHRQAEPRAGRARGARLGPAAAVVAKQGEYGAALITRRALLLAARLPLETVLDPTGAGDTFAGGFIGYDRRARGRALDDEVLRSAMAHGTALASFNVEEFGTERVSRLAHAEIEARVRELARDHPLQRRPAARAADAPRRHQRRARASRRHNSSRAPCRPSPTDAPIGSTIGRDGRVDLRLADGPPEDPDRGAVPDRALGRQADPRDRARAGRRRSARARAPTARTIPARVCRAGAARTATRAAAAHPARTRTLVARADGSQRV